MLFLFLVSSSVTGETDASSKPEPTFRGEYLGQSKPGLKPEPFAKELFSVKGYYGFHLHTSIYFSPDGKELYFTSQAQPVVPGRSCSILFMKQGDDGVWSFPQKPAFASDYTENGAMYSWDCMRILFLSNRPVDGKGDPKDEDYWYAEKTEDGWGTPQQLEGPFNSRFDDAGGAFTPDGAFYFSSKREDSMGDQDIYHTRLIGGEYTEPANLGPPINSEYEEYAICVAPDESWLIFLYVNMEDKQNIGLYISYRNPDRSWTESLNLNHALNLKSGFVASLSPDGKYLFILNRGDGIYWVDALVLEELRPEQTGQ